MEKETWKAGNMLYPLPAVMVSVSDGEGNDNIITVESVPAGMLINLKK